MPNDTEATSDDFPDPLTDSWIAFVQAPDNQSAQNRFATELNDLVRKFLRPASLIAPLRNLSDDLCQEACLLLFSKLLTGNKYLLAATRARHRSLIAGQLRCSVSAALRFTKWKALKKLVRSPVQPQPAMENPEIITDQHPANFTTLRELSLEAQQKLVMNVLGKAVRDLHLTSDNAELARTLLENNLTQADLARSLGVSRQAVSQRLNPVWRYLRKAIDDQEFPLS
jgi:DNA-directed RNA polymerase specialized sigma24 family protein